MQKSLFFAIFFLVVSNSNAFSSTLDAYDHLDCTKETDSNRQLCSIVQTVTFEGDASTKTDYENEWKVRVKSPCGDTQTTTGIFITANAAIGGHPVSLGSDEVITLIGQGPVIISDRSPALTRVWTFNKSCRLSFELVSRQISEGQKNTWIKVADVQTLELQSYIKIINRRTSVLSYVQRRDQGDASIYGTLETLINFYKTRDDLASEFMLRKLTEVRDGVPKAEIESDFDETAKTALVALVEARKTRDLMAAYNVAVATAFTDAISRAETLFE